MQNSQVLPKECDMEATAEIYSHYDKLSRAEGHLATVLVVDDDPDQVLLIAGVLQKKGYHVLCARDAAECFDMLREYRVDVVISDIMMPGMSGIELTKTLRSIPHRRQSSEVPVILVTAGSSDLEYDAITHGADLFCPKHALNKLLLKQVELLLLG